MSTDRLDRIREQSVEKNFFEGTHRSTRPSVTLDKIMPHFHQMGITRIANVTGLDRIGIPVCMAVRPNSRSLSVSQGKGPTLEAAKVSAAMESIETYHAERITSHLVYGSFNDLAHSYKIVDPDVFPKSKEGAYQRHLPVLWIEAYEFVSDSYWWLPYELVHTRYTLPQIPGSGCFYTSSTGLASGNHLLEALLHGLCEVIERDGSTYWYTSLPEQQRSTKVALQTIDDPQCSVLIDKLSSSKITAGIWESTSDIGIASFVCQIGDEDQYSSLYVAGGMGCHPDRSIALSRAITEAVQSRLTMITGSRDDMTRGIYTSSLNPILKLEASLSLPEPGTRSFRDTPTSTSQTINHDLCKIVTNLNNCGISQVFVVDLTITSLEIPVVKVIVPGLEPLNLSPNCTPMGRHHNVKAS